MALVGELLQETYRVGELLGSGGMGDVYAASHARLNRRFAVKILHTRFTKNEEAYNRFRREAQITSELGHPHIVQVVDFNLMSDGSPYIIMEFLEGADLDVRLRQVGPLDVTTTTHIARQLSSALAAAHAKKIVHRDLKPQNVFVGSVEEDDWYVKILDFGISKIRGSTSIVTQDSAVLGTPSYMSPEQAEGKADQVDHRTDQFALGTMVYEMISGTNPFEADSIPSVLYRVVHTTPRLLHELVPAVSPAFGMAVAKAMSKQRDDRFAGIREFVRVLRGLPASVDTGPIVINTPATPPSGLATANTVSTGGFMTPRSVTVPSNVAPVKVSTPLPATRELRVEPVEPVVASQTTTFAAEAINEPTPAKGKLPVYLGLAALGIGAAVVSFMLVSSAGDSDSKRGDSEAHSARIDPTKASPPAAGSADSADSADSKAPAAPTPAPPITVKFNVTPVADQILMDGQPIVGTSVELVADGKSHTVRFEKTNYTAKEQTFEATEKQTLSVELAKKQATRSSRRTKRRRHRAKRNKRAKKKKKKKSKFMLDLD